MVTVTSLYRDSVTQSRESVMQSLGESVMQSPYSHGHFDKVMVTVKQIVTVTL